MVIVKHEARMDGFSPVFSSHTVLLLQLMGGGLGKLFCHPDFANVL